MQCQALALRPGSSDTCCSYCQALALSTRGVPTLPNIFYKGLCPPLADPGYVEGGSYLLLSIGIKCTWGSQPPLHDVFLFL